MPKAVAVMLLIMLAGCASSSPVSSESLTCDEVASVESLLEQLYRSFSHAEGEEPNWILMRSLFIDGALFTGETLAGESPAPQPIDAFISSWGASIRNSDAPRPAQGETIIKKRMSRVGRLIRVDVEFRAERSTDSQARKPGLDSMTLAKVGEAWKILSFVVHYESKLSFPKTPIGRPLGELRPHLRP